MGSDTTNKGRKERCMKCYCDSLKARMTEADTAGHMGKSRTICRIKERFMWHGMVKDVLDLVSLIL